jgi:signal transduction histidine kinase
MSSQSPSAFRSQGHALLYNEDSSEPASATLTSMSTTSITPKAIVRVLIGGFSLVIILLMGASVVGLRASRSMRIEASRLAKEQLVTARLLNEIQVEQGALNAVFFRLSRSAGNFDGEAVLSQLEEAEGELSRILESMSGESAAGAWSELKAAANEFSDEALRVVHGKDLSTRSLRGLFQKHERVIRLVNNLVTASTSRSAEMEAQIDQQSRGLVNRSSMLLGACLLLAVLCALLTVRVTTDLIRRMDWQAGELGRVSWHMLQGQEATARRFSHELHDELGQALAAIRSNVLSDSADAATRTDTLQVVDGAIANVRELSQLLRPVILDDFGLPAALQWLTDKFAQRTRIQVDFASNCNRRLAEETETHLFRIAQEALTNIARHARAKTVKVRLECSDGTILLTIEDNGQGFTPSQGPSSPSLGLVGMRARARQAGGELTVSSRAKGGVVIRAAVPARRAVEVGDEESSHSVVR